MKKKNPHPLSTIVEVDLLIDLLYIFSPKLHNFLFTYLPRKINTHFSN